MLISRSSALPCLLSASLCLVAPASAQDFSSLGANPARNGQVSAIGPIHPVLEWADLTEPSLISWAPFVEGRRLFTVRQTGFPAAGGSAGDEILCYDLDTGAILWRTTLPYGGDPTVEFIAWIGGVKNGRVFAARTQNGRPGPLRALDAATGTLLWTSAATTTSFAYDGIVFASNGDPVVGDSSKVLRIDASDGSTTWETQRSCPVSGNCGVAISGGAVYFDQPAAGGNSVGKLDLATGAFLYSSQTLPGFTAQNNPFVAPDGTVYFARTQNNVTTDFLYAFDDDGTSFTERWSTPIRWTTSHRHGIAQDGGVYTINPFDELVKLDPATGAETANAGLLAPLGAPNASPVTVVDSAGTVYLSNGWGSSPATDGRMWIYSGDLATRYAVLSLDRQNQGGPAVAADGYLVLCDRRGVYAYRAADQGVGYCSPAAPNSTGSPATLKSRGLPILSAGDLTLRCASMPTGSFGYFLASTVQATVPGAGGSLGTLCLGGSVGRYNASAKSSGSIGAIELRLDLTSVPQPTGFVPILAGETWNFQCWYRDAGPTGPVSNFSDAVSVTFS